MFDAKKGNLEHSKVDTGDVAEKNIMFSYGKSSLSEQSCSDFSVLSSAEEDTFLKFFSEDESEDELMIFSNDIDV